MKKTTLLTLMIAAGLSLAAPAQTLLYQWAFTNLTDTVSNSAPSYAFTPGTGSLLLGNVTGNIFTAGVGADGVNPVLYFTNSNAGPGFGPGVDAGLWWPMARVTIAAIPAWPWSPTSIWGP